MRNREPLLLTPGPSPIPPRVRAVLGGALIHHRSEEFRSVWKSVNRGLRDIFRTEQPVITFASSGTGAMESSVTNLLGQGDKVLSFSSGKWGERYEEITSAYGLALHSYKYPCGASVDPADVRSALAAHPDAKAVLTTLCETSTGALQPVKEIAAIVRESGAMLFVDAISGLACDPIETDAWGIDVVVGASQKGLMLPPGLSFVSLGRRALARIESSKPKNFYFNYKAALLAYEREDSAFTPASGLVLALAEAIAMMAEEGIENIWSRHARVAEGVRSSLIAHGFKTVAHHPSNALTAICVEAPLDASAILNTLAQSHGIVMADGQGSLKGKIIRFAHMGYGARPETAELGLSAFFKTTGTIHQTPAVYES